MVKIDKLTKFKQKISLLVPSLAAIFEEWKKENGVHVECYQRKPRLF